MLSADDVRSALAGVVAIDGLTPLSSSAALSEIVIGADGRVLFSLSIDPAQAQAWELVRAQAQAVVSRIDGVAQVLVSLTAERIGVPLPAGPVVGQTLGSPTRSSQTPDKPTLGSQPKRLAGLAEVAHVIAVASGKGGVGKSTTACNLALALKAMGLRVGVLDADIYGPSMPKLFALKGQPDIVTGRTLRPLEAYGCKVMSIGFVVEATKAMVWRGPMVASAITQMLRDVEWGLLDVLVVDMPPGTGDAQLTMAQAVPLSGAVIVSTPQDLALIDARRGVSMFQDVGVPILGLVENMSYFVCDGCGKRHHIFAHGGARAEAAKLGVAFLGEVPLDMEIRERSDAGLPVVVTAPDGPHAAIYREMARSVWAALELGAAGGMAGRP
jgi:ATP-binding protein involved in chromosome partitioning